MSSSRRLWAILWLSVVGLYVELLLIRWIGTEIRIFAYLQNTILVVCFLGLGAGFFTSRRPPWPLFGLANLGLLVVLLSVPSTRSILALTSTYLAAFGDFYIWFPEESARPIHDIACGLLMTAFVMAVVVNVFLPVGRALGRWMDEAGKPLLAYSVNVAGSLVGTWLFVVLGVFGLPPWTWFLVLGLLLLPVVFAHRRPWLTGALAFLPLVATFVAGRVDQGETVWSPYQKLVFIRNANLNNTPGIGMVTVNNVGYMALIDLRPTADHSNKALYPPELEGLSQYDLPTLLHPHPDDVLIVGAGAGNDVAGALRNGARRVTAVEIDPSIIDFGRRYHPEHPYDDPRVRIVNDDARAFFANTTQRFDVISFGLLDSHTTSVLTNTRLDHYVYTVESLKQARRLLREGGVLTLSFASTHYFLSDRLAAELTLTFGVKPITFAIPPSGFGWGGMMYVEGDADGIRRCLEQRPQLANAIQGWLSRTGPMPLATAPATDDWPYFYLPGRGIPPIFMLLALLLVALIAYLRIFGIGQGMDPRTWERGEWHFFFLGAGFLLLEVQNISKASLVLGSTWIVNAVIITGVLVMVLIANAVVSRWPDIPVRVALGCLLGVVAILYFLDLRWFLALAPPSRAAVVSLVSTLPMAFSGVVFARSFQAARAKDSALGANLLGALLGAVLQSLSYLTGVRALLLVVFVAYGLAALVLPSANRAEAVAS